MTPALRPAALAVLFVTAPALALAQPTSTGEMAQIREQLGSLVIQMQMLTARLEALEARSAGSTQSPAAAPPAFKAPTETIVTAPVETTGPTARAWASEPDGVSPDALRSVAVVPAPLDHTLQGAGDRVEIAAGNDGSAISLKLSSGWSGIGLDNGKGWLVDSGTSLTLSAPLAKGADEAKIATLDGLTATPTPIYRSSKMRPSSIARRRLLRPARPTSRAPTRTSVRRRSSTAASRPSGMASTWTVCAVHQLRNPTCATM